MFFRSRVCRSLTLTTLAIGTVLVLGGLDAPAQSGSRPTQEHAELANRLVAWINAERAGNRISGLSRRGDLDAMVLARATELAERPHDQRLKGRVSIERALNESGIRRFKHAREMLQLQTNYGKPATNAFNALKKSREFWAMTMDPGTDSIGAAAVGGSDGWVVVLLVLLEDPAFEAQVDELARQTFKHVNKWRRKNYLPKLAWSNDLAAVARVHSEAMAREGFFNHVAPDGSGPADRVERAGLSYSVVTENLLRATETDDPAADAAANWMTSPGHRENMLDPDVTETGIGVIYGADGLLYFTQVFRRP